MNKEKRLEELSNLKENYLKLRELVVYYKNLYDNENIKEKQDTKENVKVKKLVLKKPFYGKDLVVG